MVRTLPDGVTFDEIGHRQLERMSQATRRHHLPEPRPDPADGSTTLSPTYYRLGELYEGRNNKDKALEYYGKFISGFWKDADADLQPKVREVKQRMAALAGERKQP